MTDQIRAAAKEKYRSDLQEWDNYWTKEQTFEAGAVWLASNLTTEKLVEALYPFPEYMSAGDWDAVDRVLALITGAHND